MENNQENLVLGYLKRLEDAYQKHRISESDYQLWLKVYHSIPEDRQNNFDDDIQREEK